MKIPIPKTVTEAKSLQGKFGYYRRFIPDFSKIAAPIIEACVKAEKEGKAQLNPKDKKIINAANTLKMAITSAPILGHPQWNSDEKFRLYIDFSAKALGAKITQFQLTPEGKE